MILADVIILRMAWGESEKEGGLDVHLESMGVRFMNKQASVSQGHQTGSGSGYLFQKGWAFSRAIEYLFEDRPRRCRIHHSGYKGPCICR